MEKNEEVAGKTVNGRSCRGNMETAPAESVEMLPVVDEEGKVLDKAPRTLCHGGSFLLHPVIHLHLLDKDGNILLQKRSMTKQLLPGYWDSAVGGHIQYGEKIEEALQRETFEEIGVTEFEPESCGKYVWQSDTDRELVYSFVCSKYNRIVIDNDEVDEARFWSREEIEEASGRGILTPNFEFEYQHLLKNTNPGLH